MKKIFLTTLFLVSVILAVIAQGTAEIKFDKTTYSFGSFKETEKVSCKFKSCHYQSYHRLVYRMMI